MTNLLIVVDHIPEMISAGIMSLSYRHRVVGEVDIAIITEEFRHFESETILEQSRKFGNK